jgi:hypothetical protein
MNERKFDAGSLADQIDAAKKNLESWPEWLKDSAKFQGQNHSFEGTPGSEEATPPDVGTDQKSSED